MSSGLAGLLLRAADPWDIDIENQTLLSPSLEIRKSSVFLVLSFLWSLCLLPLAHISTGPHRRSSDEVNHAQNVPSRSLGKVVKSKGRGGGRGEKGKGKGGGMMKRRQENEGAKPLDDHQEIA